MSGIQLSRARVVDIAGTKRLLYHLVPTLIDSNIGLVGASNLKLEPANEQGWQGGTSTRSHRSRCPRMVLCCARRKYIRSWLTRKPGLPVVRPFE